MGSLSLPVLIGLIVVSVDSVRNIPSLAIFGSQLPIFFVLAILLFLLPITFVSAELSASFAGDKDNGVYHWVKAAFGNDMGMFAIWNQWINSLIWFPANLLFISSTFFSIFFPSMSTHKPLIVGTMITIFWLITFLNLKGVKESARVAFVCMFLGVILPIATLLISSLLWLYQGLPSHFSFDVSFNVGSASHSLSALTVIITSFLGVEISSVHINKVINPKRTFTIAILIASLLIVAIMFIGSIAMAMMIPASQLNLYDGLAQTFHVIFNRFDIGYFSPILLGMVVFGSLGALISWTISPAIGMAQAARNGYMPEALARNNKNGAPKNILFIQASIITILCLSMSLFEDLNNFYWYLISLSTAIYLLMYIVMFLAGIKLRRQRISTGALIKNHLTFYIISGSGLIGVIATFIVGFLPSKQVLSGTNIYQYIMQFGGGIVVISMCFFLFICFKKQRQYKRQEKIML
ncbi:APC family permease [Vibrio sp. S4M6]|uniref:APC family permease n=1 Tax=Vibrio sinus TaxID=2946865 RepID=UPI002029EC45|nr:APC family permease [Vibrio sinus]MCL9779964.1 APC family permease [Vibrio sinus]